MNPNTIWAINEYVTTENIGKVLVRTWNGIVRVIGSIFIIDEVNPD